MNFRSCTSLYKLILGFKFSPIDLWCFERTFSFFRALHFVEEWDNEIKVFDLAVKGGLVCFFSYHLRLLSSSLCGVNRFGRSPANSPFLTDNNILQSDWNSCLRGGLNLFRFQIKSVLLERRNLDEFIPLFLTRPVLVTVINCSWLRILEV